ECAKGCGPSGESPAAGAAAVRAADVQRAAGRDDELAHGEGRVGDDYRRAAPDACTGAAFLQAGTPIRRTVPLARARVARPHVVTARRDRDGGRARPFRRGAAEPDEAPGHED